LGDGNRDWKIGFRGGDDGIGSLHAQQVHFVAGGDGQRQAGVGIGEFGLGFERHSFGKLCRIKAGRVDARDGRLALGGISGVAGVSKQTRSCRRVGVC
jgi:hypothetical protein